MASTTLVLLLLAAVAGVAVGMNVAVDREGRLMLVGSREQRKDL